MMRRYWPFLFLIAFVLILTFHSDPPSRLERRSPVPPAVADPAVPKMPELAERRSPPPPPTATVEPKEEQVKPESRSAVLAGLIWVLRQQNDDGSWGDVPTTLGDRTIGKTGVTSLVLLSLLGAGYSHLSRDEYDGIIVGPLVKKAVTWLISQQREDGTFGSGHDDRFDNALATLALSEAYGMTASQSLKDPTALSLDALVRLQGADGSWGGTTPTPWAIEALVSGELSELSYPTETREKALDFLRTQARSGQLSARHFLKDHSDPDAMESLAQSIANSSPRAGETDFESLYHQTLGLYQYDGAGGALWKKWAPAARDALLSTQNPDGSWNGGSQSHRLVRTSLAELSLEIYYRYVSNLAFGR